MWGRAVIFAHRPSLTSALDMIAAHTPILGTETIPIRASAGRCLATPVHAGRDYPVSDVSAMDGYAIFAADIMGTSTRMLALAPPHFAGAPRPTLSAGTACPIATGAVMPMGSGAVLVKEHALIDGDRISLSETLPNGMNIRRAAEDASAGEEVLAAGNMLHAATIGALCAYGVSHVHVRRRPAVALLVSGDELKAVGEAGPHDIVDANGPMVSTLLERAGAEVRISDIQADDLSALIRALRAQIAGPVDMIVCTGGVSAGERDLLGAALDKVGAIRHFHGVAMRPGKPVLFATLPDGRPVIALPGNPVAALVGARFFVMRSLRAMLGLRAECPLRTAEPIEQGVTRVHSARRDAAHVMPLGATILPHQQSHRLRPLLAADAWMTTGGGMRSALYPLYDRLGLP